MPQKSVPEPVTVTEPVVNVTVPVRSSHPLPSMTEPWPIPPAPSYVFSSVSDPSESTLWTWTQMSSPPRGLVASTIGG